MTPVGSVPGAHTVPGYPAPIPAQAPPPPPLVVEVGGVYEAEDANEAWHLVNVTAAMPGKRFNTSVAAGNFTVYDGTQLSNTTFNNSWTGVSYDYMRATPAPPPPVVVTTAPLFYAPDPVIVITNENGTQINGTGEMVFHGNALVQQANKHVPVPKKTTTGEIGSHKSASLVSTFFAHMGRMMYASATRSQAEVRAEARVGEGEGEGELSEAEMAAIKKEKHRKKVFSAILSGALMA